MRYLAIHEDTVHGTFGFPIQRYVVGETHPRYEMPFHWHMECELILVKRGGLDLSLDGERLRLEAGDCAFLPPGAVHGGTPEACLYECAVFDMERFLQGNPACYGQYADTLGGGAYISSCIPSDSPAAPTVAALFAAMEQKEPGGEFLTTGLLWQFVGLVLRWNLYTRPTGENLRRGQRAAQMKQALRRIRVDYAKPLTLGDLAAEANMVPQYFCRVFKQVTGSSPIEYLNYYRVECAAELLCQENARVTDVALACGFKDLSYFIRLFKRCKGLSPSAYRTAHTMPDKETT